MSAVERAVCADGENAGGTIGEAGGAIGDSKPWSSMIVSTTGELGWIPGADSMAGSGELG